MEFIWANICLLYTSLADIVGRDIEEGKQAAFQLAGVVAAQGVRIAEGNELGHTRQVMPVVQRLSLIHISC